MLIKTLLPLVVLISFHANALHTSHSFSVNTNSTCNSIVTNSLRTPAPHSIAIPIVNTQGTMPTSTLLLAKHKRNKILICNGKYGEFGFKSRFIKVLSDGRTEKTKPSYLAE